MSDLATRIVDALQNATLSANRLQQRLHCPRPLLDDALDGLLETGLLQVAAGDGGDALYTACGQPLPPAALPEVMFPRFILQ